MHSSDLPFHPVATLRSKRIKLKTNQPSKRESGSRPNVHRGSPRSDSVGPGASVMPRLEVGVWAVSPDGEPLYPFTVAYLRISTTWAEVSATAWAAPSISFRACVNSGGWIRTRGVPRAAA